MTQRTGKEMEKFRGSKYVQSLIGDSYTKAKKLLKEGRLVVFSGIPCQIAGLYGYLGGWKYENLVTVDLVYHGTPSPRLLKRYLSYEESQCGGHTIDYRSRDKYYGYQYSTATIYFDKTKNEYHKGKESDFMLGLYFRTLISRPVATLVILRRLIALATLQYLIVGMLQTYLRNSVLVEQRMFLSIRIKERKSLEKLKMSLFMQVLTLNILSILMA